MPENLMNKEHIATNEAYRENYERIFKRECPYLCDFGGTKENVYCQVVHSYVKECHPACLEKK